MFDNSTIKAPKIDKPHIVKIGGLWRVIHLPKRYIGKGIGYLWLESHIFVAILNRPLLEKMFNKEK